MIFSERPGRLASLAAPFILMLATAATWLLNHHHPPWKAFHGEALAAAVLLGWAGLASWRFRQPIACGSIEASFLLIGVLLSTQWVFGLVTFRGQLFLSAGYAALVATGTVAGRHIESRAPTQLLDWLLGGIGIAALVSTGITLFQWLGLTGSVVNSLTSYFGEPEPGTRPFANLGQSNHLATLLVWGLGSLAWALHRRAVSPPVAALAASFLVLGVSLSGSRTAQVFLFGGALALWFWRPPHLKRLWLWRWTSVLGLLVLVGWLAGQVARALFGSDPSAVIGRVLSEPNDPARWQIWSVFLDAIWARPWFGYGWNGVGEAYVAMATTQALAFPSYFSNSHNLLLDALLIFGIPIGGTMIVVAGVWTVRRLRAIRTTEEWILWFCLMAVLFHAMLEYPLYYGYFLFPAALMLGGALARQPQRVLWTMPRSLSWGVVGLAFGFLVLAVVEYADLEARFFQMRFDRANIGTLGRPEVPDVWLFDQLQAQLTLANYRPKEDPLGEQMPQMRIWAKKFPSAGALSAMAEGEARLGRDEDARYWMRLLCELNSAQQCQGSRMLWERKQHFQPDFPRLPWVPELGARPPGSPPDPFLAMRDVLQRASATQASAGGIASRASDGASAGTSNGAGSGGSDGTGGKVNDSAARAVGAGASVGNTRPTAPVTPTAPTSPTSPTSPAPKP